MSVERRHPAAQCHGKKVYPRKRDAKRAAKRLEVLHGRMRAYRCPHCDRFHLGHQPRRRTRTAA